MQFAPRLGTPGKSMDILSRFMLVLFAFAITVIAQSTTWTGAASASWGDPGNWTSGVPNSATSANIPAPTGAFTPSTNGVASAACLNLTLQGTGDLNLAAGFPLAVHGNAT